MRRQAAEADATILREQGAADSLLARAIVLAYALDIARQPNSSRNGTSRQPDEVETGQPGG